MSTTCFGHNLSTHSSRIGQQLPHSGRAQSAILTYGAGCGYQPNYREYLQAQLTTPMVIGQSYDVEFYISLGDEAGQATNNFGVHFRNGSYYNSTCFVIPLTPQFNHTGIVTNYSGWTKISGTVVATAAWDYVIFGNFYSNAATSISSNPVGQSGNNTRYYIDDVTVQPSVILAAPSLKLEGQRAADGSALLRWHTDLPQDGKYTLQRMQMEGVWENVGEAEGKPNLSQYHHDDRFPPKGELTYRVRFTDQDGRHFASENFTLKAQAFPYALTVAPQPASEGASMTMHIAHADDAEGEAQILDLQGRTVWQSGPRTIQELNGSEIPSGLLSAGVYILRITTAQGQLSQKLMVQ